MARPSVASELRRSLELLLTVNRRGGGNLDVLAKEFGFASTAHLEDLLRGFQEIDLPEIDPTIFEIFFDDHGSGEMQDAEPRSVHVPSPHELFRTPPRLTVPHALMVLAGLQAIADIGDHSLQAAAHSLSAKLRAAVVNTAGPGSRALLDHMIVESPSLGSGPEALIVRALRDASGRFRVRATIWRDRAVDVGTGGEVDIVLDPIRLVAFDGRTYLYAYDGAKDDFMAIPLYRVIAVEVLEEHIDLPVRAPTFNREIGALRPVSVELDLAPEASWVPEYYQCRVLGHRADGHITIAMPVPSREWVVRLLRRLGGSAQISSEGLQLRL